MFSTKLANFGKSLDDMRYSNKVILNLAFAISIFFSCNSYTESNSAVEEYLTPDDLFANAIEIKGEKEMLKIHDCGLLIPLCRVQERQVKG